MELEWKLCSIMGEILSNPGAEVLEYLETVEIISCSMNKRYTIFKFFSN